MTEPDVGSFAVGIVSAIIAIFLAVLAYRFYQYFRNRSRISRSSIIRIQARRASPAQQATPTAVTLENDEPPTYSFALQNTRRVTGSTMVLDPSTLDASRASEVLPKYEEVMKKLSDLESNSRRESTATVSTDADDADNVDE